MCCGPVGDGDSPLNPAQAAGRKIPIFGFEAVVFSSKIVHEGVIIFRRVLASVILSSSLLLYGTQMASAAPGDWENPPPVRSSATQQVHEGRSFRANLESEGLSLSREVVSRDAVGISGFSMSKPDDFSYQLDLVSDGFSVSGNYVVTNKVSGKNVTSVFQVRVAKATAQQVVFDLDNKETGEKRHYDSSRPHESVAFAIPIGIAAFSLGTLLYYLAVGAAIIVVGYIALEAAKAAPKIWSEWQRNRAYKYYMAFRSGSKVYLGKHLTDGQAQLRGRSGGDVWSVSSSFAKTLAKKLNPRGVPIWNAPHGPELFKSLSSLQAYAQHAFVLRIMTRDSLF